MNADVQKTTDHRSKEKDDGQQNDRVFERLGEETIDAVQIHA